MRVSGEFVWAVQGCGGGRMMKGHTLGLVKLFLFFCWGGLFWMCWIQHKFYLELQYSLLWSVVKILVIPEFPFPFIAGLPHSASAPLHTAATARAESGAPPPPRARNRTRVRSRARANVESSRWNRLRHVSSTIPFACPLMPMFPTPFKASYRSWCRKAAPYLPFPPCCCRLLRS